MDPSTSLCLSGCGKPTFNKQPGEFCGTTCRQGYAAKAAKASLTDDNAIGFLADKWVRSVWPSQCGTIKKFYRNPGLGDRACPVAGKFLRGVKALGLTSVSSAEFAWHGTASLANVQGICWNGLDPNRRSGQSLGPGEYFSTDANVSLGYSSSSGYMIVCLLLKGGHSTVHNTTIRVVNNPTAGDPTYCLPVGVVDFGAGADPQLQGTGGP